MDDQVYLYTTISHTSPSMLVYEDELNCCLDAGHAGAAGFGIVDGPRGRHGVACYGRPGSYLVLSLSNVLPEILNPGPCFFSG